MAKDRNQNPVVSDILRLKLHVFNSNQYTDLDSVDLVEIYYLDSLNVTSINPDGRILVTAIQSADITLEDTGKYYTDITLTSPLYVIGKYIDVWTVTFDGTTNEQSIIENSFTIYPDLWLTSPVPLIHDFDFNLLPNRLKSGSIKYLTVEIVPNVLRATDLEKYYENLAISSDIKITIIQTCGVCLPQEEDLRTVIDAVSMTFKDRNTGYYLLDTTDMDCGIYDITFKLTFGDTVHISPKIQFEIYS